MANVNGYIKNQNGAAIPFATVTVYDAYFQTTGEAIAANSNGYFSLNVDPNNDPYALGITSVGYKPASVQLPGFANGSTITMQADYVGLPPVVVTSGKKNNWSLLFLLFGVVLLIKKK